MNFFGKNKENNKKIAELSSLSDELQAKTASLTSENKKLNSLFTGVFANIKYFDGQNTEGELDTPSQIIIDYELLRIRSWEFIIKNHLANQIANKRVNWTIGKGLLFNSKPSEKPFLDYYKDEAKAKEAQTKFVRESEYLFRNYANTKIPHYSKNKNLHELARQIDYNAIGDGDVLVVARVKNGYPNFQPISGQVVVNPNLLDGKISGKNKCLEGVEYDSTGKIVAYHVLKNSNTTNGIIQSNDIINIDSILTERIKAYFAGTDINSAWLYYNNDLVKLGETRAMPLLSHVFEVIKHLNDYLIANAKNAQLMAQVVMAFEKSKESDGTPVFNNIDNPLMGTAAVSPDSDTDTAAASLNAEVKMKGNGVVIDLPKGVTAKQINSQAQSNQEEYLKSTLQTISSAIGIPYEVLISSYNSNYTASMGARSDYQFNLDVLTEIVPANQFYKKVWQLFVYTQVLSGKIICEPLLQAYNNNDTLTIQAITNSSFEGTKLKPIDPLKFVKSLREKLPESVRSSVPLDTIENIIADASGQDFEGVVTKVDNEIGQLSENFSIQEQNI